MPEPCGPTTVTSTSRTVFAMNASTLAIIVVVWPTGMAAGVTMTWYVASPTNGPADGTGWRSLPEPPPSIPMVTTIAITVKVATALPVEPKARVKILVLSDFIDFLLNMLISKVHLPPSS